MTADGLLALGGSETTFNITPLFEQIKLAGTVFYAKTDAKHNWKELADWGIPRQKTNHITLEILCWQTAKLQYLTVSNATFFRLYKAYIMDSIFIVRNHGFKELLKRKGWKFPAVIFLLFN